MISQRDFFSKAVLLIVPFVFCGNALAVSITVLNSSFEADDVSSTPFFYNSSAPSSWGLSGTGGVYNPQDTYTGTRDGVNVGWLRAGATFGQWIGPLVVGTTYTLSALVAGQNTVTNNVQYQFSFVEGLSPALTNYHTLATSAPGSVTEGVFNLESFSYTVTAATYPAGSSWLGIHLSAIGSTGQVLFDKISLEATVSAVPEPEIYAMMGLGLGFLGWIGRRKRLKAAGA